MLTNKKVLVRVIAFALVLVMTSAIFLGCKNDQTQADIEAAQQAAADAQKAAEDAAKLAEDLKAQLDATKKELEELQNKPADKDDSIKDPEFDGLTNKFVTEKVLAKFSALKAEYLTVRQNWYTNENYKKVAEIFEEAAYQLYRATSAEGVEAVINNAQTAADAVDNIVSDAAKVQALIAAFGDVDTALTLAAEDKVDDAEAALKAFAAKYAPTLLPTADPKKLTDTQIDTILAYAETITEGKAYINVADDNGLDEAQLKIEMLGDAADEVDEALALVMEAVGEAPATWTNIAKNAKDIQDAYELYKRFYTLNGGDDSAVLNAEEFIKEYVLVLFDKEFAKYQVIAEKFLQDASAFLLDPTKATGANGTVFDSAYSDALKVYSNYTFSYENGIDAITPYAVSVDLTAETVKVNGTAVAEIDATEFKRDFNRIISKELVNINALDFEEDFKGVKSLEDAYREIDQFVIKAVIEMTNFYYTEAVLPVIEAIADAKIAYLDEKLTAVETKAASTVVGTGAPNAYYADTFEALAEKLAAKWEAAAKKAADVSALTYDALNSRATDSKLNNISQTELFDMNTMVGTDGLLTGTPVLSARNGNAAAMNMIFAEVETVIEEVFETFFEEDVAYVEELDFFDFKMDLAIALDQLGGFNGVLHNDRDGAEVFLLKTGIEGNKDSAPNGYTADSKKYYTLVGAAAYFAGDDDIKRTDMFNELGTMAYDGRVAIMNLELDAYKSSSSTAKDKYGKTLYFQKDKVKSFGNMDDATIYNSDNIGTKSKLTFTIEYDKLANAKIDATAKFVEVVDKMIARTLDSARGNLKKELASATDSILANYATDAVVKKDAEAYSAYLTALSDLAANNAYNQDDLINLTVKLTKGGVPKNSDKFAGYYAEQVGSSSSSQDWNFIVRGLASDGTVSSDRTNYVTYGDLFEVNKVQVREQILGSTTGAGKAKFDTGAQVKTEYVAAFENTAAKEGGEIYNFFMYLNAAGANARYNEVRELAWYKADALTEINDIYYTYVGQPKLTDEGKPQYDANGDKIMKVEVNPDFAYEEDDPRAANYLEKLANVKAALTEAIGSIDLTNTKDYPTLAAAKTAVGTLVTQSTNAKSVEEDDNIDDDDKEDCVYLDNLSFTIAYRRYWLTSEKTLSDNQTVIKPYDWTFYNANID